MLLLLVDDHTLVREGLRMQIEAMDKFERIVECPSMSKALEQSAENGADVGLVMLDLNLEDAQGPEVVELIRAAVPGAPILVISAEDQPAIISDAIARGAQGYLPKSSSGEALRAAVASVLEGTVYLPPYISPTFDRTFDHGQGEYSAPRVVPLTSRQGEVLIRLAKGLSNKEIAEALKLSLSTVRVHVSAVFDRLDVENRTQAATSPTARFLLAKSDRAQTLEKR